MSLKSKKIPGFLLSSPTALYLFVSFIAFFPCLVLGRAYFDNDLLAQFGPWRAFLRDRLFRGHFPLWNPYSLGGEPFFANLQNMMLYPFNYLTLPFPVAYGLSVFFFIHLFWAALGAHLWLRVLGLSENTCRTGALLFAFSGFFWLEIIHPPVLAAYSWLPWLFLFLEKLAREKKTTDAFFGGLSFALLFLCGSFQVTLGAFYGGLVYFLFRSMGRDKNSKSKTRASFWKILFFLFWGALPLLGQLIPTMEFSALTDRRVSPPSVDQLNPGLSLNPSTLGQFLLPRFTLPGEKTMAEAIQGREIPEKSGSPFLANLGYLGIWIPFLAFMAFRGEKRGLTVFFLLFSGLSLAVCLGKNLPVHAFLFDNIPGFSMVLVPFRFLYLFILGLVVLSALGFEEWSSQNVKKGTNPWALFLGPVFYAGPLLIISFLHPGRNWREITALVLGLAGIFLFHQVKSQKTLGSRLFQSALILPLLLSAWADFTPGPASNFDFEANSQTIPGITKGISPYRVIFDTTHLKYPIQVGGRKFLVNYPQNAACALKIKNFGGYNPLLLQTKMDITQAGLEPLVHLGAIKGILTQENTEEIPGFKKQAFPPYQFYEYQSPLAWAYAPEEAHVVPDEQMITILQKADFDLTRQVLFSEPPPFGKISAADQGPVSFLCRLEKDGIENQNFTLQLSRDNWVVFTEVMFPGWMAWVDGKEVPMVTADHLLRSIYLTAGSHQVEFIYKPDWALPILVGLILWLLTTLAFALNSRNGKRLPKRQAFSRR